MARGRLPRTEAPDALRDEERQRIRAWSAAKWPFLKNRQLQDEWERCRDWHLANGVLRSSWEAAFRNWLRKAAEIAARPDNVIPLRRYG